MPEKGDGGKRTGITQAPKVGVTEAPKVGVTEAPNVGVSDGRTGVSEPGRPPGGTPTPNPTPVPEIPGEPGQPEPWRDASLRGRWMVAAGTPRWLHPFVLLGETRSFDDYRQRIKACVDDLTRRTRKSDAESAIANEILKSDLFVRCRSLDEAGWRAERREATRRREEWYELEERIRHRCEDDELTGAEVDRTFQDAEAIGVPRPEILAFIAATYPGVKVVQEPGDLHTATIDFVRAHAPRLQIEVRKGAGTGPVIPKVYKVPIWTAEKLAEYVTSSRAAWDEAVATQPTLALVAPNLQGSEGERIHAACEQADRLVRDFKASHKLKDKTDRDVRLWLQALAWALVKGGGGQPAFRVPEPWDGEWVRTRADLVKAAQANPDRLQSAFKGLHVHFWLAQARDATSRERTRKLVDSAADWRAEARALLWESGETRLLVGRTLVTDASHLARLLDDPDFAPDHARLDQAIDDGTLAAWCRATDQKVLHEGVVRATAITGSPERRRASLRWTLGAKGILPNVEDAAGLLGLSREAPATFDRLFQAGVVDDWVRARGLTDLGAALDAIRKTADPDLRRRQLAWRYGDTSLTPDVREVADWCTLAIRNPDQAVRLVRNGSLAAWLAARGVAVPSPAQPSRDDLTLLHQWLWALGRRILVVRGTAWENPAALLAAVDRHDEKATSLLEQLRPHLETGLLGAWLAAAGPTPSLAPARDLLPVLWKAGLKGFHHPATGWHAVPASLAAWADGSAGQQATFATLLEGSALTWIQLAFPALLAEVEAARKGPRPQEMVKRALGLPPPTVAVTDPPSLDFGALPEGRAASRTFHLAHQGPRGEAAITAKIQGDGVAVVATSLEGREHLLHPGQTCAVTVTVTLPSGKRTAVTATSVTLLADGRALGIWPVRVRSVVPTSRRVVQALVGLALLGAAGFVAVQYAGYREREAALHADIGEVLSQLSAQVQASQWTDAIAGLEGLQPLLDDLTPAERTTWTEVCRATWAGQATALLGAGDHPGALWANKSGVDACAAPDRSRDIARDYIEYLAAGGQHEGPSTEPQRKLAYDTLLTHLFADPKATKAKVALANLYFMEAGGIFKTSGQATRDYQKGLIFKDRWTARVAVETLEWSPPTTLVLSARYQLIGDESGWKFRCRPTLNLDAARVLPEPPQTDPPCVGETVNMDLEQARLVSFTYPLGTSRPRNLFGIPIRFDSDADLSPIEVELESWIGPSSTAKVPDHLPRGYTGAIATSEKPQKKGKKGRGGESAAAEPGPPAEEPASTDTDRAKASRVLDSMLQGVGTDPGPDPAPPPPPAFKATSLAGKSWSGALHGNRTVIRVKSVAADGALSGRIQTQVGDTINTEALKGTVSPDGRVSLRWNGGTLEGRVDAQGTLSANGWNGD